jgi:iron complex outermembrane recepter protein
MNTGSRLLSARIALVLSLAATATPSLAQSSAEAGLQLEEIIVTARKRDESLMDVPISIAAFTDTMLRDMGVTNVMSLDNRLANVVLDTVDYDEQRRVSIRGISSSARTVGQESGFGVYIDGVYTGRAETYNQQLPDIASVEVLRGPQGTIFGKNTIAGAMSLNTRRPAKELEGNVTLEAANNGTQRVAGFISGPISDGLLYGKFAGTWGSSDGYATNVWNNSQQGTYDFVQARLQLRATPTENLELLLSADYYKREYVPYVLDITESEAGLGVIPGDYTVIEYIAVEGGAKDSETENSGVSLQVDYAFAGGHELTSITAYRESGYGPNYIDNARVGLDLFYTLYESDSSYLSQELRLASPVGERLDYVVGAYYSDQESTAVTPFILGSQFEMVTGFPLNGATFLTTPDIDTTTWALFAHGNYRLSDSWSLSAGIRYTDEDKDAFFYQQGVPPFIPSVGPLNDTSAESEWSPTVGVDYRLNEDAMVYGRITRGYKSGGFNADNIASAENFTFGPEFVTNYEIGLKSEWWDRRVRLNAAVFYMDYEDLQVTQFDQPTSSNYIDNAASATSQGLEIEVTALPLEGLELSAALGLLDATYDEFVDAFGRDLSGNDLAFAPKVTGWLAAQYGFAIADHWDLVMRGEATYRDDMEGNPENSDTSRIEGYTLFNARVGLRNQRFEVALWGNNLADERYANFRQSVPKLLLGYQETTVTFAAPRSYGVTLTYSF